MSAVLLAVVAEEAPSSISGSDQVRAALVLGICLLAMALLVALAVRQARRRQRDRSDVKPDQNGSSSRRSR